MHNRREKRGGRSPAAFSAIAHSYLCGPEWPDVDGGMAGLDDLGDAASDPPESAGAKPLFSAGGRIETTTGCGSRSIDFAMWLRWFTEPRGTPKPAEPGLIVSLPDAMAGMAVRPLPTKTV